MLLRIGGVQSKLAGKVTDWRYNEVLELLQCCGTVESFRIPMFGVGMVHLG